MNELRGASIHISGIVQGVGFRPFVYGLATRLALLGWVRNTSAGVDIEVEGPPAALQAFITGLTDEAPPLARIDELVVQPRPADGFQSFEIVHSQPVDGAFQPISPDVSICPDCQRELFDPLDRRYRYPFINCTNCGPRFTIIEDIPYDRPKTTMASFPLCPECAAEYSDPLDRRFHAQPVACPVCGPQVWLELSRTETVGPDSGAPSGDAAIREARRLLAVGQIVAIKGLGGFHLACDATNLAAVDELRRRKLRVDKPFALMALDMETIARHSLVNDVERALLESRQRPVVILRRRPGSPVASQVAPHQVSLGFMLPYTPLHYLLLAPAELSGTAGVPEVLVMTSGNLSEEPIATDNAEARQRLSGLADAFLMHDRPIRTRCDDSVLRVFEPQPGAAGCRPAESGAPSLVPLRRARGYAPFPVRLPRQSPPVLATGAELKNTFCITRDRYAFLSHHIGDLENYETLCSFKDGVAHFERLFRIQPQAIAYDLHPDYLATRYALERAQRTGIPAYGVQHHHAHIAACMAEHGLPGEQPVIGVAFDGTGYGADGAIWGGEFLLADYTGFQRAAHLAYIPLPGGDKAVREPWRIALAWLQRAGLEWSGDLPCVQAAASGPFPAAETLRLLQRQLETGLNAPLTSSMGRLFDAVAALAGVRQSVNYEAQAAIELEALVDPQEHGSYPFESAPTPAGVLAIDPLPLIRDVLSDRRAGVQTALIAARFHNSLAWLVVEICHALRAQSGAKEVVLSGGVWQNLTLLGKTLAGLQAEGFTVYIHRQVPANDGGLALGQAAVAIHRMAAL